jgi:hypothetical protein
MTAFGSCADGGIGTLRWGIIAGPFVLLPCRASACPATPEDTKVQTSFPGGDLGKHAGAKKSRTTRV